MQSHLAAGVKRKDLRTEAHLIIRTCAVVVAEIGLLAKGDHRYWIQGVHDVDDADWDLYRAVVRQPGFYDLRWLRGAACGVKRLLALKRQASVNITVSLCPKADE